MDLNTSELDGAKCDAGSSNVLAEGVRTASMSTGSDLNCFGEVSARESPRRDQEGKPTDCRCESRLPGPVRASREVGGVGQAPPVSPRRNTAELLGDGATAQAGRPGAGLLVRVERAEATLARYPMPSLQPYERARAARFVRDRDVTDYIAAHLLAREVVAASMDVDLTVVEFAQTCGQCGGTDHGRPSVLADPAVAVSWSHARGVVAAAAARAYAVGVDTERACGWTSVMSLIDATATPAEAAGIRASTDPESAFLRLWTRKEALVKAGALTLDQLAEVAAVARRGISLASWYDREAEAWVAVSVAHRPLKL